MNLSMDDLKHCHMVLSGDIRECEILEDKNPGRYEKRINIDKQVIAKIEQITGKIDWKFG